MCNLARVWAWKSESSTFFNHIASIAKENELVVAQVDNATKEQALNGNLLGPFNIG
jgi:type I restriction enzyme R subunit